MEKKKPPSGLWGMLLVLGPSLVWAGEYIGSGEVIIATRTGAVLGPMVMWAVLIGAVLNRERPSLTVITGLGLGLLGVALLIGPANIAAGNGQALFRMGVVLVACFSWALGTHYSRRSVSDVPELATIASGDEWNEGVSA